MAHRQRLSLPLRSLQPYAGDGIYGATIPAYSDGTIVEFYIQANATGGNRNFPDSASTANCM